MNKKRVLWIGLVACSTLAMFGALDSPVTVFTIGDSTMAPYDTSNNNPQRGWAQMLPQFFDNGVTVVNAARGGRSSKSFYNEGLWSAVITQVKSGDYVFIQFAHNDEKTDTAYQTDPWTSYSDYLTRYATETRAKGGIPIFFTPICRRYFGADGKITATGRHNIGPGDSAGNFPMAMRALAVRLNVPLIDLTVKTEALDEAYGAGPSADLFIPTDQTHPNILGATIIARYATLGLKEQNVFPLASHVDTASSLIVSPKSLSFGDAY
ncbi:MAG: rhamnogalacturonan acetylesterase, partial [Ignavibacteriae bacterium]